MFALGIILGIYGYIIFFLGVFHLLFKQTVNFLSLLTILITLFFYKELILQKLSTVRKFFNKSDSPILFLILLLALINFVGVLGPELSFDALWYHLTLPKIYLSTHTISHIPGGLLYFSDMPRMIEMLYTGALSIGNETIAKFAHFLFGILITISVYKISRFYLNRTYSLLASLAFYSNLVVAWLSTTAYIDLGRTFYEVLALWAFLLFEKNKKTQWLFICSVLLGFAISTKLIAMGSLFIFSVLIVVQKRNILKNLLILNGVSLLIASPWFLFSFLNTGNPIYPFFTGRYDSALNLNPIKFFPAVFHELLFAQDPISPIYLIIVPLLLCYLYKFKKEIMVIPLYVLLGLICWYVVPQTGGGRFLIAYLPAFSVLSLQVTNFVKDEVLKKIIIGLIVFIAVSSIFYRGVANLRYLPVILGIETKESFLTKNLNFNFGDFYDTDGYFQKN